MATIAAIDLPSPPFARWVEENLRWPDRMPASQWVEQNLYLEAKESSKAGPVDLRESPHIRQIMDDGADPTVRKQTLKKCTQSAGTTAMYFNFAHKVSEDPGPALFVGPTEDFIKSASTQRILPFLRNNAVTRRYISANPYDTKALGYNLRNMLVNFGWATSPSSLAARPVRFLYRDECDKYPRFSGREADPIKLSDERNATYWNAFSMDASTPTHPGGYITRQYEASDQAVYCVECWRCRVWQPMVFTLRKSEGGEEFAGGVKWPKDERDPDVIEREDLAWYECAECQARWTDEHRRAAIQRGIWRPKGARITKTGRLVDCATERPHRGYQWSKLVMPEFTFSRVAAEFLRSYRRPELLMNFVNSWLGEAWEEYVETAGEVILGERLEDGRTIGEVPAWAWFLTAGVDVQKDHAWWSVYAWGAEEKFALVAEGKALTPESGGTDLDEVWAALMVGGFIRRGDGALMQVTRAGIDARYRQEEVYSFARRAPERIFAAIGSSRRMITPHTAKPVDQIPGRRKKRARYTGILQWTLDTGYYKSLFARLTAQGKLDVPDGVSGAWYRQIQSERKKISRDARGAATETWELKPGFDDNHQIDTAMLATAMADIAGYWTEPDKLKDLMSDAPVVNDWFKQQREKRKGHRA